MKKSAIKKILQIGIIVEDVNKTVKSYEEVYGIGPWKYYTLDSNVCSNMKVNGKRIDFKAEIAKCYIGELEFELIQPLDDISDYARYLKEHGEGVHHFAIEEDESYQKIINERKIPEIKSGNLGGVKICRYFDTRKDLGIITETYEIK